MKRSTLPVLSLVAAAVVAAVVLWPARTGDGPEPIALGRDTCARCRMILSEPGWGGEIRDAAGTLTKYDDLGCLLAAEAALAAPPRGVWAELHEGGGFVPLETAVLVRGERLSSPMGSGLAAFADAARAQAFATERGARIETLAALRAAGPGGAPAAAAAGADLLLAAKPGGPRPLAEKDAMAGKAVYLRECSACHGERGDGRGPAAEHVAIKPRDFTRGVFKLRTTDSGMKPATADVLRTIERGIPGTSMPSFSFLTPDERRKAAAYVLYLADALDSPEPQPIPDPGAPPETTPATVARGKELYATLQCGKCHGDSGKGDGPSAAELRDDRGAPIQVRDFTGGEFRGGAGREDLYARFVTGMDGTPMPSYADSVAGADRWALVDYVMSLRVPQEAKPLPQDPVLAGRVVAERRSCRGCHVLDDGKGGEVGPDLRVSGQKLGSDWVRAFLRAPREAGKIYPWRPHRMPDLRLSDEEVEALARYLAAIGQRKSGDLTLPAAAAFDAAQLEKGKSYFLLRCTECHNLGTTIEIPEAKRQGPDLAKVARRVDYEWAKSWILDPKKIDAKTKMTNPGITPDEVEAVRAFVWKTSLDLAASNGSGNGTVPGTRSNGSGH